MADSPGIMVNPTGLSVNDLRQRIYSSFKEKGLLDSLKTQLRNMLVDELHKNVTSERYVVARKSHCMYLQTANILVADHLQNNHYDYTLSMFLPECRIEKFQAIDRKEILDCLKIDRHSIFYKNLNKTSPDDKSFIWHLLYNLSSVKSNQHDISSQTDPSSLVYIPASTLEEKLQSVDNLYSSMKLEFKRSGHLTSEERILSYQKEIEERCRKQMTLELDSYKKAELAKIKLEEQENYHQKLNSMRKELEQSYKIKSDALIERERKDMEQLQRQQKLYENETFNQRQQILQEIETLRQKQKEISREQEINVRKYKLEEERLHIFEKQLKEKESNVEKRELMLDQRIQDQVRKSRLEQEEEYMSRLRDVELREIRVKESEQKTIEDQALIVKLKTEINTKKKRIEELELALQETQVNLLTSSKSTDFMNEKLREMVDYKTIKEEAAVLKKELETTKHTLAEVKHEYHLAKSKHEDQLKVMTEKIIKGSPEITAVTREIDRLRQEAHQEQRIFSVQKDQLELRLQKERDQNKELLQKYSDQSKMIKQLQELYSSLKTVTVSPAKNLHSGTNVAATSKLENLERFRLGLKIDDLKFSSNTDHAFAFKDKSPDLDWIKSKNIRENKDLNSVFLHGTRERVQALGNEALNLEHNYQELRTKLLNTYILSPAKKSSFLPTKEYLPDHGIFDFTKEIKTDFIAPSIFKVSDRSIKLSNKICNSSTPVKPKETKTLRIQIPDATEFKDIYSSEPSVDIPSFPLSEITQSTMHSTKPHSYQKSIFRSPSTLVKDRELLPLQPRSASMHQTISTADSSTHSPNYIVRSATFIKMDEQKSLRTDFTAQNSEVPLSAPIEQVEDILPAPSIVSLDSAWKSEKEEDLNSASELSEKISQEPEKANDSVAPPMISLDDAWKPESRKSSGSAEISENVISSFEKNKREGSPVDYDKDVSHLSEKLLSDDKKSLDKTKIDKEKSSSNSSSYESEKKSKKSNGNLMKAYMEKILQQKQKESKNDDVDQEEKSTPSASDFSVAEDKSQGSDIFTWD